jgi:hypothetical protein
MEVGRLYGPKKSRLDAENLFFFFFFFFEKGRVNVNITKMVDREMKSSYLREIENGPSFSLARMDGLGRDVERVSLVF